MTRIDNCSEQFFRIQGVVIFEINYLQSFEFEMDDSFLGFKLSKVFMSSFFFPFEKMKREGQIIALNNFSRFRML